MDADEVIDSRVIDSGAILSGLGLGNELGLSTDRNYRKFWHTSAYDESAYYMHRIHKMQGSLYQEEQDNFQRALNRIELYNGTRKNLATANIKHGKNIGSLPLISKVKNGKISINKGYVMDRSKRNIENFANFLPIEGKSVVVTKPSLSNPSMAEDGRSLPSATTASDKNSTKKQNSPRSSNDFENIRVPKIEHHGSSIPNIGRRAAVSLTADSRLPPISCSGVCSEEENSKRNLKQTRSVIAGKLQKPKTKHNASINATSSSFNLVLGPINFFDGMRTAEYTSNEVPPIKKAKANILKSQQSKRKTCPNTNANRNVVFEQHLMRCNSFIKGPLVVVTDNSIRKAGEKEQRSWRAEKGETGKAAVSSVNKNAKSSANKNGSQGKIEKLELKENKKKKKVTFKTKPSVCFLCKHEDSKRHQLIIELPSAANDFALVSRENTLER